MQGVIEEIYIAPAGGESMRKVDEVRALAGRGLEGDRYCLRTGYWSGTDECQVTLIRAEDIENIVRETGLHVQNGEHRRNLITRDVDLNALAGKQFRIGEAVLRFNRPRPPCGYIQSITERGMTKALAPCGGICADVVEAGLIRAGDELVAL